MTALEDADIAAALAGADTVVISIGGNDFLQPMISAVQSAVMSDPDLLSTLQGGETQLNEDNYMQIMTQMMSVMLDAVDSVDVPRLYTKTYAAFSARSPTSIPSVR